MSHAKIFIRQPPHQTYVQGYPSIPGSDSTGRPPAHLSGTVEIRPGPAGIYAAYLQIELQKVEVVYANSNPSPSSPTPISFRPGSSSNLKTFIETIDLRPITLWSPPNTTAQDDKNNEDKSASHDRHRLSSSPTPPPFSPPPSSSDKTSSPRTLKKINRNSAGPTLAAKHQSSPRHQSKLDSHPEIKLKDHYDSSPLAWAPLAAGDFDFKIPLPLSLPPSVTLDPKSGLGIKYVLCATLCARPAKPSALQRALFKKSFSPLLVTASTTIDIIRHDLHPAWPIYQLPPTSNLPSDRIDPRSIVTHKGLSMRYSRDRLAIGPGDEISFRIRLESETIHPTKIARFEILVTEHTTFYSQSQLKHITTASQKTSSGLDRYRMSVFQSPSPSSSISTSKSTDSPDKQTPPELPHPDGQAGGQPGHSELRKTTIVDIHARVNQDLLHKNCVSFDVKGVLPLCHNRVTITTGSHLKVEYFARIRAVFEHPNKQITKQKLLPNHLEIDRIPIVIGDRDMTRARAKVEEIGPVPHLSLSTSQHQVVKPRSIPPARPRPQSQVTRKVNSMAHPLAPYPPTVVEDFDGPRHELMPKQLTPPRRAPDLHNKTSFTGIGSGAYQNLRHPQHHQPYRPEHARLLSSQSIEEPIPGRRSAPPPPRPHSYANRYLPPISSGPSQVAIRARDPVFQIPHPGPTIYQPHPQRMTMIGHRMPMGDEKVGLPEYGAYDGIDITPGSHDRYPDVNRHTWNNHPLAGFSTPPPPLPASVPSMESISAGSLQGNSHDVSRIERSRSESPPPPKVNLKTRPTITHRGAIGKERMEGIGSRNENENLDHRIKISNENEGEAEEFGQRIEGKIEMIDEQKEIYLKAIEARERYFERLRSLKVEGFEEKDYEPIANSNFNLMINSDHDHQDHHHLVIGKSSCSRLNQVLNALEEKKMLREKYRVEEEIGKK